MCRCLSPLRVSLSDGPQCLFWNHYSSAIFSPLHSWDGGLDLQQGHAEESLKCAHSSISVGISISSKSRDTALQRHAEEPWCQAGKWLGAAAGSTFCPYPSRPFSWIGASANVAGPERRKVSCAACPPPFPQLLKSSKAFSGPLIQLGSWTWGWRDRHSLEFIIQSHSSVQTVCVKGTKLKKAHKKY